ncbi:MAG: hypothetical protein K5905_19325 [Roseibium sp.]|uniref:DUF6653 family protein n=1 Tax=Roseibium sp. TaxID=1936156 RepID=UPI00262B044F|nr:DUF6653 family protein [Roseibium sp.]MCV0427617.1 hypothetical protein [Roseibium sp.]
MQNSQRHLLPKAAAGQNQASGANTPLLLLKSGVGGPVGPASTYAKIVAPALITAAIWTKIWLDTAFTVMLVVGVLLLLFRLPKLLPNRRWTGNWAEKASFGERIWLNRPLIPIPQEINHRLSVLHLVFWAGVLIAILGAFTSSPILSGTGLLVGYATQAVCLRKLIDLYELMKDKAPLYRFWTSAPENDNKPKKNAKA